MRSIADQLLDQLHAQERVVAVLDAELEREPDRKKAAPPADPKPRTTNIKRPARVVEIKTAAATTANHSTDTTPAPKIPEPLVPADEIAERVIAPVRISLRSLFTLPWKTFIARTMLDHPDDSVRKNCEEADSRRKLRAVGERSELSPPDSWMKDAKIAGSYEELMEREDLWSKVYENSESRHQLESEFSRIRKKLRLKKRGAK